MLGFHPLFYYHARNVFQNTLVFAGKKYTFSVKYAGIRWQFLRTFLFLVFLQSSRCWIGVRINPTRLIHITQLKVIFLTCAWKQLFHGATQLMKDGHNWVIKLVTNFTYMLPWPIHYSSNKNQFILKLQIILDIFNQKRKTWLDKIDILSCALNLSSKRTCKL